MERSGQPKRTVRLRRGLARRLRGLWSLPECRFAIAFFAYLGGGVVFYPALKPLLAANVASVESFTAEVVFRVVSGFAAEVELAKHNTVYLGPHPVKITEECSGIYEALLLGAAMLAFPTTWTKAAIGFAIGFPMIYLLNIARIIALLFGLRYFGAYFDFLHLYFWPTTMVLMVVLTFSVWALWAVRTDSRARGEPDTAA